MPTAVDCSSASDQSDADDIVLDENWEESRDFASFETCNNEIVNKHHGRLLRMTSDHLFDLERVRLYHEALAFFLGVFGRYPWLAQTQHKGGADNLDAFGDLVVDKIDDDDDSLSPSGDFGLDLLWPDKVDEQQMESEDGNCSSASLNSAHSHGDDEDKDVDTQTSDLGDELEDDLEELLQEIMRTSSCDELEMGEEQFMHAKDRSFLHSRGSEGYSRARYRSSSFSSLSSFDFTDTNSPSDVIGRAFSAGSTSSDYQAENDSLSSAGTQIAHDLADYKLDEVGLALSPACSNLTDEVVSWLECSTENSQSLVNQSCQPTSSADSSESQTRKSSSAKRRARRAKLSANKENHPSKTTAEPNDDLDFNLITDMTDETTDSSQASTFSSQPKDKKSSCDSKGNESDGDEECSEDTQQEGSLHQMHQRAQMENLQALDPSSPYAMPSFSPNLASHRWSTRGRYLWRWMSPLVPAHAAMHPLHLQQAGMGIYPQSPSPLHNKSFATPNSMWSAASLASMKNNRPRSLPPSKSPNARRRSLRKPVLRLRSTGWFRKTAKKVPCPKEKAKRVWTSSCWWASIWCGRARSAAQGFPARTSCVMRESASRVRRRARRRRRRESVLSSCIKHRLQNQAKSERPRSFARFSILWKSRSLCDISAHIFFVECGTCDMSAFFFFLFFFLQRVGGCEGCSAALLSRFRGCFSRPVVHAVIILAMWACTRTRGSLEFRPRLSTGRTKTFLPLSECWHRQLFFALIASCPLRAFLFFRRIFLPCLSAFFILWDEKE